MHEIRHQKAQYVLQTWASPLTGCVPNPNMWQTPKCVSLCARWSDHKPMTLQTGSTLVICTKAVALLSLTPPCVVPGAALWGILL